MVLIADYTYVVYNSMFFVTLSEARGFFAQRK